MTRGWSIGTRTAVAFALATMALVAGALVFVNLASQWSLSNSTTELARPLPWGATTSVGPDPDVRADGAAPVAFVRVVAAQQWQWSAVGVVVAGVLAGVLGWLLSRSVLRPIDRITRTADRISASTLHERTALDGPDDEVRRLSRTIDALLDRLEAAFDAQRQFIAHAAHELRTPLAVQRASLQIGLSDGDGPQDVAAVRAELLEQNRRTEHLVESLLVLAEAERGLADRTAPIDLVAIVADVVAQAGPDAARAGVGMETEYGAEPVGLTGEPLLVRQLVGNLVDNAVEYNHVGGWVRIRTGLEGVTVENTGPVLDPALVDGLAEPFRRGGEPGTKRHSGLGLSIVAAIAESHGWTVHAAARDGGGLRVSVGVSPM
ncbi:sensor histidine kinase [Curtobacterium caseinilyticum]|uniref:histidine kinase n=1 Tax=Curtobacterium caseinilyticum TaxID=3055137 RepID=A0ABT7TQY4_9MICO|nr:HAMP domain-containing sensor histidine kinase [Curtobacterium caseinilyticum]MDM7892012.1 HAMP domain-containing sensor histidine kinase [Curtobacterium caseinilyticum]